MDIIAPGERAAYWANRIAIAWRSTVQSIIETGQLLVEAKADPALDHGEWLLMISQKLPFKARTAQMLMAIARDPRLTNANHGSLFPPHWRTLYEIHKLPDPLFQARIEDGTIHPECERRDIVLYARKEQRKKHEVELGAKLTALPDCPYGVILADPPWRLEPYSRETGGDRAADNHYATTPTAELVKDKPRTFKDAVLFMWATAPMLPDALWLMEQWGFGYRSHLIWKKDRIGTGYWARNLHELLLIGVQGNVPAPALGDQPNSVIDAPIGAHSVKPAIFHEIIERLFPSLPKLEMYQRSGRSGWDGWGAEAPATEAA